MYMYVLISQHKCTNDDDDDDEYMHGDVCASQLRATLITLCSKPDTYAALVYQLNKLLSGDKRN